MSPRILVQRRRAPVESIWRIAGSCGVEPNALAGEVRSRCQAVGGAPIVRRATRDELVPGGRGAVKGPRRSTAVRVADVRCQEREVRLRLEHGRQAQFRGTDNAAVGRKRRVDLAKVVAQIEQNKVGLACGEVGHEKENAATVLQRHLDRLTVALGAGAALAHVLGARVGSRLAQVAPRRRKVPDVRDRSSQEEHERI
eukprot:scaffold8276_cov62-Phaeocystis_antarctica.AAC.8